MNTPPQPLTRTRRAGNWNDLLRGGKPRPMETLVETGIFLVSLSALVMILLIFLFVGREALPVVLGRTTSANADRVIPPSDLEKLSPDERMAYLGLKPRQLAAMDQETLRELMRVKAEAAAKTPADKDAALNTTRWRLMLGPHQWTGYDQPEFIWQPNSPVPKYNLVPLLIGSLKVTLVALLVAVPLAIGAAIYVSQIASPGVREWVKPGIELLSGIPSIVLGFLALIVVATLFQSILGSASRLNAFVAGSVLGLAVIPVVFSIAEDALTSVPRIYTQAALALGSSNWQAAWRIVLPAALPGVFAAVVLGFGRAIGETMVVLMASGNASIVSWNLFDSARTLTATIAAELAETVFEGTHYRVLFLLGALLFLVTFLSNMVADIAIHRLRDRLEGKT
jgi:phosphate transport system permease protein